MPYISIVLPVFLIGILGAGVYHGAYIAEVVRAGISSIPKGQFEAAYSQGFSNIQTMRYIILPQSIKKCIPTILSQETTVIKDTSYLWAVGIEEFTGKGMILMGSFATSSQVFLLFGFIALSYFIVNFISSCTMRNIKTAY